MKLLPPNVSPFKRTPDFTERTIPAGLLRSHETKDGVWGKIVVLEGALVYRILEPRVEEIALSPDRHGVIEPTVKHEVVPSAGVRFYVEFHRANAADAVTIETLDAFADAFNRHDADAVMSFMTEDCVFESSAGPDVCGTRYVGREAVRAGFAEVFATFPDANWGGARHFIQGDRGVSEWTFTGTRVDGSRVEVHGCDVFTFRDGKIALKDSYRKNRPPVAP
jgi:steroid delta-isomerase-like uncharacterized protein